MQDARRMEAAREWSASSGKGTDEGRADVQMRVGGNLSMLL